MIEHFYTSILPSIEHFHLIGYWVAFFAALFETALVVGLLLPGSTLLLLLGALSAAGQLDFGDLLWFAVAGAVLGDNLNYWLGRRYGNRWIREGVWFLKPAHFEQARLFFDRHGAKSVFLGRFIPSVKEVAPFVAGTVGMHRRTFLFWNVLGGIGWGLQWVGGGYLFGQSLNIAQVWMSRAGMALVVVLFFWLLLWLSKRFVVRHGREGMRLLVSLMRSIKEAVRSNAYVTRLSNRHPKSIHFLSNLFDRSHFYGLPLTLLVLAFGSVLALFAGIVEDVVTSDPVVALDHATAQLIAAVRAPDVIPPFIWITSLGDMLVVAPLVVSVGLLLWLWDRKYLILALLASCLGASAFNTLGKLAFHRPRPVEAALLESSYSFPSGHASIAVAFYGFVGYLLIRSAAHWQTRVNLFFATCVLVLLIGLSRIMLGVHYLSDVWAGYLAGALWLIVGISLSEWMTAIGRLTWQKQFDRRRRWAAFGLGGAAVLWYLTYAISSHPPIHTPVAVQIVKVDRPFNVYLRAQNAVNTVTLLGEPEQPIAFGIVARDAAALRASLELAGWKPADKTNPETMLRLVKQGLDYATAPLAPAFWDGHINDIAFERTIKREGGNTIATIRLWETSYKAVDGRIFTGIAREYDGIRWGVLHQISPDVDGAADRFVESLKSAGLVTNSCRQTLVKPMIGTYLWGDRFFSRGEIRLLDLVGSTDMALLCGAHNQAP